MLRIGLTGGIGSGKSTVARIFEILGIPVYYADTAAKEIMNEDKEVKASVIKYFGNNSYDNGILNRSYISSVVFKDKEKLELLNTLVHPGTIRASEKWMQQQHSPYAVKEAALIFESGSQENLDYVIGVYAPKTLRIHRTMQRDNILREQVLKRMENQINEELKMMLCNAVIKNDEQHLLIPQVVQLHQYLLKKAAAHE